MNKFNILILLCSVFLFTSCQDDDSDNSKSLIGSWIRVSIFNQAGEDIILDCQKDDSFRFNQDGSGSLSNNDTNCSNFKPYSQFTWKELDSGATLQVNYGSVILTYKIQEVNASSLKLLDGAGRLETFKR